MNGKRIEMLFSVGVGDGIDEIPSLLPDVFVRTFIVIFYYEHRSLATSV